MRTGMECAEHLLEEGKRVRADVIISGTSVCYEHALPVIMETRNRIKQEAQKRQQLIEEAKKAVNDDKQGKAIDATPPTVPPVEGAAAQS